MSKYPNPSKRRDFFDGSSQKGAKSKLEEVPKDSTVGGASGEVVATVGRQEVRGDRGREKNWEEDFPVEEVYSSKSFIRIRSRIGPDLSGCPDLGWKNPVHSELTAVAT